MIGFITSPNGNQFSMDDDGVWSGPDPVTVDYLNESFNMSDYSPADGEYGWRVIRKAAEALGAKPTITAPRTSEPGAIY